MDCVDVDGGDVAGVFGEKGVVHIEAAHVDMEDRVVFFRFYEEMFGAYPAQG